MKNHSYITECPITGDTNQKRYFDLGEIPLVNNLCDDRESALSADRYPLNINYYEQSGLSSLNFAVDSELLFSHYLFKSGVNVPYIKHCEEMFQYAKKYVTVVDGTKIADIGGNDGTLLDSFRSVSNKKLELLNIDPSKNLCELSLQNDIPVCNGFFSYELSQKLNRKFDLVTSTNVFQHLKDIDSFARGVENILSENGIWILEFPYWIHHLKTNQFDQIYHEHMYYHSAKPINLLISKNKMKIINVSEQKIHGGTLRLIICKKYSKFETDLTLENFLDYEKKFDFQYHLRWQASVKEHIMKSKNLIKKLLEEGKTIYGFGAAAKGCIYLNSMNLNHEDIEYIIDDTDIKQNKFMPGTGMKIVSREILKEKSPDYILILSHNFANYIMESLNQNFQGSYILLLPEIQIIESKLTS